MVWFKFGALQPTLLGLSSHKFKSINQGATSKTRQLSHISPSNLATKRRPNKASAHEAITA
jgi:hypothetical protein